MIRYTVVPYWLKTTLLESVSNDISSGDAKSTRTVPELFFLRAMFQFKVWGGFGGGPSSGLRDSVLSPWVSVLSSLQPPLHRATEFVTTWIQIIRKKF